MSGEHLYAKSFGHFREIDWPSSAYYTRKNEATELRLVLNERFLFVVAETHRVFPISFLYRHVLGVFFATKSKLGLTSPIIGP